MPSPRAELIAELIKDEGMEFTLYEDTRGIPTIGVGRNLRDKGITFEEAVFLLKNDILECEKDLYSIFGQELAALMGHKRWNAFVSMRLNLGPAGFRGFERMIEAAKLKDWEAAAFEILDSKYARDKDTKSRAERIAKVVLTGKSE